MIAVWIVAGILLALFLLLLCPVTIVVGFQKEFTIKIRYLFFTYQVAPRKEKPKKEAKEPPESEKKEPEEHKKSKFQEILEEKGISGLLKLLRQVGEVATRTARRLFSHLVVTRLHLEILVADEDAAQAAVNYGDVYKRQVEGSDQFVALRAERGRRPAWADQVPAGAVSADRIRFGDRTGGGASVGALGGPL